MKKVKRKYKDGRTAVSDTTSRIEKPELPIGKIKRKVKTVVPQFISDDRTEYAKKESKKEYDVAYEQQQQDKKTEEGIAKLEGFLEFADYAGIATGAGSLITKGVKTAGKKIAATAKKKLQDKILKDTPTATINYSGDKYDLLLNRAKNGGFDKLGIKPDDLVFTPHVDRDYRIIAPVEYTKGNTDNLPTKFSVVNKRDEIMSTIPVEIDNRHLPSLTPPNASHSAAFNFITKPYGNPKDPVLIKLEKAEARDRQVTSHELWHKMSSLSKRKNANDNKETYDYLINWYTEFGPFDDEFLDSRLGEYYAKTFHERNDLTKIPGIKNKNLSKKRRDYLFNDDGEETLARGVQIKNYFGITDANQPITTEMYKYAKKNMVKDTGLDNNMTDLFNSVKKPKDFLNWLNPRIIAGSGVAGTTATTIGSDIESYNQGKTMNKTNKNKLKKYDPGKTGGSSLPDQIPSMGGSSGGGMSGGPNYGAMVTSAVDFAGHQITDVWNDPNLTTQQTASVSKGPIQYLKRDYVNSEKEFKNLSASNKSSTMGAMGKGAAAGATIGAVAGPVGAAIGGVVGAVGGLVSGLFGARNKRKKLRNMINRENTRTTNLNQFNLADAHTDILQNEYLQEYGDTQGAALYKDGKTPGFNKGKANSLVGNGETIVDGDTGELEEVTQGRGVGIDDVPANIQPQDAIAGNLTNPRTGNTFAEDMKPLTRMEKKLKRNMDRNIQSIAQNTEKLTKAYTQPLAQQILTDQAMVHYNKGKSANKYDKGKTGGWSTAPNGTAMWNEPKRIPEIPMAGIIQAMPSSVAPTSRSVSADTNQGNKINWGNIAGEFGNTLTTLGPSLYNLFQGSRSPDTVRPEQLYSPNARAMTALNAMSKRRYNMQPEVEALRGLDRRQRYNARQMGSESGLGRAMDVASSLNLQRAISDIYGRKQNADNQYLGDYASMAAQIGSQEASNRSNAMMSAYDINARNKAAVKAYTAAGLTGLSDYAQSQRKLRNQKQMDDMRMQALRKYLEMNTTNANINDLLGGR